MKHFDIKVLGKTKKLLRIEFEEEDTNISIHQLQYIDEVCFRFKDYNFPICSLLISKGMVYSKSQCPQTNKEINEMLQFRYRSILGCLSFITHWTRPNISYAVNIFSHFQSNPEIAHWNGLLQLLGYVNQTKDLKLKLSCKKINLITYTGADFLR